ncbi:hypothetical protein BM523_13295 [Alteromonas mediterranea]|nr:hypothetical protein BM523_13295 [Alteromonas mediterranea]APD98539.1 hypothetical protein BM525_13375 [Alteromonas mediterranea]
MRILLWHNQIHLNLLLATLVLVETGHLLQAINQVEIEVMQLLKAAKSNKEWALEALYLNGK